MKRIANGNGWRIVIYQSHNGTYLHFYCTMLIERLSALGVDTKVLHKSNGTQYLQRKASELNTCVIDSLSKLTYKTV